MGKQQNNNTARHDILLFALGDERRVRNPGRDLPTDARRPRDLNSVEKGLLQAARDLPIDGVQFQLAQRGGAIGAENKHNVGNGSRGIVGAASNALGEDVRPF